MLRFLLARRWARRLVAAVVILVLVAGSMPSLVVRPGLVNRVLAGALSDLDGSATVGGVSLGWFSPLVLEDVRVRGSDGEPFLVAPRVVGSKGLLALLRNKDDLGTMKIERPTLSIVCTGATSNVEKALARYLEPTAPSDAAPALTGPALRVELTGAEVSVRDADTGATATLSDVAVTLAVPRDRREAATLLANGSAGGGRVEASLTTRLAEVAGRTRRSLEGTCQIVDLSMTLARPVLRRVEPGTTVDGTLQGSLRATWTEGGETTVEGTLRADNVVATSPRLGGEPVRLGRVTADGLALRLDAAGAAEARITKPLHVERLALTPKTCAGVAGYALPLLAGSADAEGEMSLVLDAGRIALANPEKAELQGRVVVHGAKASAGPLVRELASLLRVPAVATLPRGLTVPVRLADGRVHHESLQVQFGGVTVRTSGSVGADSTLDLAAELPLPSQRLGGLTEGQTVRLPVVGTLTKPKVDGRALEASAGQLVRDGAAGALRKVFEVNKR